MLKENFKRTKLACYFAYLSMSSVFSLPPMLFVTFKEMYGVSYTLLGTLVLINFCTQLTIDLIFTFFAKHFNIKKTVRVMPLITTTGLLIYALSPVLFPNNVYIGLCLGTVIFSISAGLSEVLLSPVVAAIPSKTPEKDMSMLHSLYGWGVVSVIVISSAFFALFGRENWMYLTVFLAFLPIIASVLFCISPMPQMNISGGDKGAKAKGRSKALLLCAMCIFLGSAAENSMTNWISGYMENALNIPKSVGDILGMAVFALLLSVTRNVYAKYGKNISKMLLIGMIGAFICYLTAGLSSGVALSFLACILMGIFTSMLWPGTLILMEEKIAIPGVTAYALMASAGDFGASVAPQLLGVVVDKVSASHFGIQLASSLSLTPEQIGMKAGMLMASAFPFVGMFVVVYIMKKVKSAVNC